MEILITNPDGTTTVIDKDTIFYPDAALNSNEVQFIFSEQLTFTDTTEAL